MGKAKTRRGRKKARQDISEQARDFLGGNPELLFRAVDKLAEGKTFLSEDERQAYLAEVIGEKSIEEIIALSGIADDPREQAREFSTQALFAEDAPQALELAAKALALDPENVDARLVTIVAGEMDDEARLAALHELADKARAAQAANLAPEVLERDGLHPDARPLLSVLYEVAEQARAMGRKEEAYAAGEELLRLDAEDDLGARYTLAASYLADGRLEDAGQLLDAWTGARGDPAMGFARVLERLLADDDEGALTAMLALHAANRHAAMYLSGKKRLPEAQRHSEDPASPEQAALGIKLMGEVIEAHSGLIEKLVPLGQEMVARDKKRMRKLR